MWIQVAQLILGLSILIVLHELGHFIPAKIFKTRIEKFYLFFDWKFSLLKKKIGETEYGIGWLPLGGYVKIAGMVDESMDTEALKEPPKPWEFRSKPAWQRLIILTGGVIVNFILGYVIYVGVLWHYGQSYLPNEALKYGIATNEAGREIGLQNGDKIVSVNGKVPDDYREAALEVTLGQDGFIEIERNGQRMQLTITEEAITKLVETRGYASLIEPRIPFVVGEFAKDSNAKKAGLQENDSIVGINGKTLAYYDELTPAIRVNAGKTIDLEVYRAGKPMHIDVLVSEDSVIGIRPIGNISHYFNLKTRTFTFGEAAVEAVHSTWEKLSAYVRQFKLIFNFKTKAYKEVGGFYSILKQYDAEWNWQRFWEFTAFLSLMLGFLNILPIPALDGGHVMFTIYEMITGRQPNTRVLEIAQMIGFFLLLALLIFANGQDFLRAIGKG